MEYRKKTHEITEPTMTVHECAQNYLRSLERQAAHNEMYAKNDDERARIAVIKLARTRAKSR